jgi:hypothetical protein
LRRPLCLVLLCGCELLYGDPQIVPPPIVPPADLAGIDFWGVDLSGDDLAAASGVDLGGHDAAGTDLASGELACTGGAHWCGQCVTESATSCGAACAICPVPSGGAPVCKAGVCDFTCRWGNIRVGDACVEVWHIEGGTGSAYLHAVWGSSATDVYVVGDSGVILHSHGDGSWTAQASGTTYLLFDIWGSSASDIYAVGHRVPGDNVVLHSTGDGKWTSWGSLGGSSDGFTVWGSGPGDVYIGAEPLFHGTGSASWTALSATGNASAVWGTGAANVYAGDIWSIYHLSGTTWKQEAQALPTGVSITAIWGSSASDVYAAGHAGIYHSTGVDDWTAQSIGDTVNKLWGSSPNDIYAAGDELWHSTGGSFTRDESLQGAQGIASVWGSSASDVYVVSHFTILHKVP